MYIEPSEDFGKIEEIKDTSDKSKIADKVFEFLNNDIEYWSRSGPFPRSIPTQKFNKGFSNPSYKKIKSYFNRFGYDNYKGDLARVLQANYQITINMVDHLVDTRNKIAHGDQGVTKTPGDVGDMERILKEYCVATDSVFGDWFKSKFCPIR